MKNRTLTFALVLLGAWMAPGGAARADTVLYDNAMFIQGGAQSFVQSFDIKASGMVTIQMTPIPWWDTVSSLSCFLTTASGVIQGATMNPDGSETMAITTPGTVYAHWFGTDSGAYKLALFSSKIVFRADVTAVPLPDSAVLLLCGLGLVFFYRRFGVPPAPHRDAMAG